MMNRSSKGKGIEAKQEDNDPNNNENNNLFKAPPPSTSSSRQWSAFRNPRIVRVSRSFGGKDRHSKVCTIRGLRDRRIRLSVPTAIQLYDLQDRLGLTQPSKVVDWLLDATKNDIDNLPPLQMPQGFGQFHHPQMLLPRHHDLQPSISPFLDATLSFTKDGGFQHHSLGIKMNTSSTLDDHNTMGIRSSKSTNWGLEGEAEGETSFRDEINGKGKMIRTSEDENENGLSLTAQKLFPLASTNSSLPSFFNNNPPNMPSLNPYNYHWDASSLSLSQFGIVPQPENNSSSVQLPSSLAGGGGGGGGSQFFFCPPVPVTMPSFFPQYPSPFATPPLDNNNETRELSHFHFLNSGLAHSNRNNSGGGQTHKDQNADP